MSADNYLYVRKREDGKFGISMRFASIYYADEGHTVESLQESYNYTDPGKYVIDSEWISPPPPDSYGTFDDAEEAVMAAHKAERKEYVVEYGVILGDEVLA